MNRRGLFAGWCAWVLTGCPSDPADSHDCVGEPDFLLAIRSETGSLPRDLQLEVEYGGGEESYTFHSTAKPQIVFCSPVTGAGGSSGSGGDVGEPNQPGGEAGAAGSGGGEPARHHPSLECALYTEGPASLKVTALGFEPIERDLKLDEEDCTTSVELELELEKKLPAP